MEVKTKYLFIGFLIALNMNGAYAQTSNFYYTNLTKLNWNSAADKAKMEADRAKEVMQCNEFDHTDISNETSILCNPLLLDGKTLNYGTFALESKGLLTVVKNVRESAAATPIPFYVSIRRNGKMIEDKKMSFLNKALYEVNVSNIFPHCKQGDMLIIKPVRKEDWQMKRILKLIHDGC